jgi:ring-1,2-phenylacetyl-CoA epoxidase subunit PaaE
MVLIGGGSGVVPLFSLLKQTLTVTPSTRVLLILANSSEKHIIFYGQLTSWEKQFPDRLKVIHVLSQASDDWAGLRGRLNNMRLEHLVTQYIAGAYSNVRFFLCGPSGLMRTAAITLKFLGFEQEQIRRENFVIEKPFMSRVAPGPQTITLRIKGEEHRVYVAGTATILDASLAAGIPVPYSCKGGKCSSCAAICRTGKVHMSFNEVLTDREMEQGWILTCTSYADDDQVLIDIL